MEHPSRSIKALVSAFWERSGESSSLTFISVMFPKGVELQTMPWGGPSPRDTVVCHLTPSGIEQLGGKTKLEGVTLSDCVMTTHSRKWALRSA